LYARLNELQLLEGRKPGDRPAAGVAALPEARGRRADSA